MQQAPASRQGQLHRYVIKIVFPADRWQAARCSGDQAVGGHGEFAALDLDTGQVVAVACDQLILPFDGDPTQLRRVAHGQPRGSADVALHEVAQGHGAAVEAEPETALQGQFVGCRLAVATTELLEAEAGFGAHQVAGQIPPFIREGRLLRVDRWRAFNRCAADQWRGLIHPHLFVGEQTLCGRQLQRFDQARMTGDKADVPGARPCLHFEAAIFRQRGRQGRAQFLRDEFGQQRPADADLAALAGDF